MAADGGVTWARTPATATVGQHTVRAAVRPDGALLIQAGISAGEAPMMFASTDGVTWTWVAPPDLP